MIDATASMPDLLLIGIALSMVLGLVLSGSTTVGLIGGSVPAGGLIGYALFIDPPVDR